MASKDLERLILRTFKALNLSFTLYFCQDIGTLHSAVWLCTEPFVEGLNAARGKLRPFPTLAVSDPNPFLSSWTVLYPGTWALFLF
ncbi:mCG56646 [Mus musculus]|jgi:hypothetical protein|nr:mCG56646 [Mus musculus]